LLHTIKKEIQEEEKEEVEGVCWVTLFMKEVKEEEEDEDEDTVVIA
jgi:hypothetical protein